MDKRIFFAYTAGFVDADGCIQIVQSKGACKRGIKFQLRVDITQHAWMPVFEDWQSKWGGSVFHYSARDSIAWRWAIVSQQALSLLEDIEPFLQKKRPQAKLGMSFQRQMQPRVTITDEQFQYQEQCYKAMKALKKYTSDDIHEVPSLHEDAVEQLKLW